jgi:hypothetical protein
VNGRSWGFNVSETELNPHGVIGPAAGSGADVVHARSAVTPWQATRTATSHGSKGRSLQQLHQGAKTSR